MTAGPALEMWSKQTGDARSDGRTASVTMQRAFTITLGVGDRLEEVYNAAGLPLVGQSYPGANFLPCVQLSPQRVSPIMAIVTAEYSGEVSVSGGPTSSPIDNTPSIQWSCSITDAEIDEDWEGKPIVTKNNEPIYGLTEKLVDDILTIERNFLSINRYALRQYRRATNSDTFYDWPAGTCRLIDDTSTPVFINGSIAYWRVRATFQFREPFRTTAAKAWYKRVRHEGFLVRDSAGSSPHKAWDLVTKAPVSRPVLLKADGTRLPEGSDAHWLEIQTLGSLPFNSLGMS